MKKLISSCGMLSECWRQTGGVWAGWKEVRGQWCEVAAGRSARKNGERRYVCGFLVGGRGEEARKWGSVGKPDGALRRKPGASVIRAVLCAGMGERRYRRSAFLAQGPSRMRGKPGRDTDGRRFPRSRARKLPTLPDSRAAGIHAATPRAPRHPPSHEKSPGRTTGALSERYISFVDSSFSSTHSFSRMTGFLSTRPSRSAGKR